MPTLQQSLTNIVLKNGYQNPMPLTGISMLGYGKFPSEVVLNHQKCNLTSAYVSSF